MQEGYSIPYGFQLDPTDPEAQRLMTHAGEHKTLALMRMLRASDMSYRRIAHQLQQLGYRSRKGTPFTFGLIHYILTHDAKR